MTCHDHLVNLHGSFLTKYTGSSEVLIFSKKDMKRLMQRWKKTADGLAWTVEKL